MRRLGRLGRRTRTLPPAAAHFQVYGLRSLDPARDRDRSYALTWQPGLVGDGALVRCWGRTGGAEWTCTDYYPDRAAAQAHVEALLRRRLRRGYRVLAWE